MIEQIKEALEKATPGPWSMNDMDMEYSNEVFINPTGWEYVEIAGGMRLADAHLIANTPTYIRYLLEELEKADKEIAKYHKLHDEGYNENRFLCGELEKAQKLETGLLPLSSRQAQAYDFIVVYIKTHGYSPSNRELQEELGYGSVSTAHALLKRLEYKGYIKLNGVRGMQIIGKKESVKQ